MGNWIDKALFSILKRRVASRQKSDRTAREVRILSGQNGAVARVDNLVEKFWEVVYEDPFVSIAVNKIINTIAGLDIEIGRDIVNNGKIQFEVEDNHPVKQLLDRPNINNTSYDLKRHLAQSLLLQNEAFLTKEVKGKAVELYLKAPHKFKVIVDNMGEKTGYEYTTVDGRRIPFQLDEVIHILNYDATSPHYGRSMLKALWKLISLNHYSMNTNIAMMENGGVPAHLALTAYDLDTDQINQLQNSFEEYKTSSNRGKLAFAPDSITDIKQIQNDFKDMMFSDLTKLIREIIFATFGLPPFVGGVMEYANYANAVVQEQSFWRNGIIPILRIIEDGITYRLMPAVFPEMIVGDYVAKFNLENVEALQADLKDKAQVATLLTKGGIWTPNETRDRLFEMAPIEGGDELVKPQTMNFGLPGNQDNNSDEENPDEIVPPKKTKSYRGLTKVARREHWKKFDKRLIPKDNSVESIVRRYFKDQSNRIVTKLDELTSGGKVKSALSFYGKKSPIEPDPIFFIAEENQELIAITMPMLREIMRNAGEDLYDDFSIGYGFNMTSPNVRIAIAKLESQLIKVNDLNYDIIRNLLSDGYERGLNITQIANLIRSEYSAMADYRAARIARTEVLGAYNYGGQLGMEEAGADGKEWVASLDSFTRDSHAFADGQIVGVNDLFTQGLSVPMMFPGDPGAPASEIVNCRCTTIPVFR